MLTKKQAFNFYKSVICPMFRCNFKKLLDFSQFSKKKQFCDRQALKAQPSTEAK